MKNRILSGLLVLVITLATVTFIGTQEAQAAQTWQTAYAQVLQGYDDYASFSLYDIDRDGVPELIVYYESDVPYERGVILHSFKNGNLIEPLEWPREDPLSGGYRIFTSQDNSIQGVFIGTDMDPDFRALITLQNDEFFVQRVATWTYDWSGDSDEHGGHRIYYFYVETIENNLIVEGRRYNSIRTYDGMDRIISDQTDPGFAEARKVIENLTALSAHPANSIQDAFLMHNVISVGRAAANATTPNAPHPFAVALREFLSAATGDTSAVLIDVDEDGVEEMYAFKQLDNEGGASYALFYFDSNRNLDAYYRSGYEANFSITDKNYLISVYSMGYNVSSFERDKGVQIVNESIHMGESPELNAMYGLSYEDSPRIMHKKSLYDNNETTQILAMTINSAPTTPAPTQNNAITVTINNIPVNFAGQAPVIVDGRTLVPVRGVFEALGFNVSWNAQAKQATLSRANDKIVITIDSATFTANGANRTLDVPAQIIGGSTMIPLRAVLESVGYRLNWNENTRTIVISTN